MKKVADSFGNYGNYNVKDFGIEVSYSSNSIKESASKVTDKKVLAKLFPIIDQAIENAVGISSENNRYYYDRNNVYYHTLLSGYIDGDYFVPIRFGVKENNQGENKLYVVLGQNKIDLRVLKSPGSKIERNNSRLRSIISISEIFKNVNPNDRYFLKYIPNQFLSDEQVKAKRLALREDDIKYARVKDGKYSFGDEDEQYLEAVQNEFNTK